MNEEKLKMMIQSTAPKGVSANLRDRAIESARDAALAQRRGRAIRWGLGFSGMVAAGVVVASLGILTPKAEAASAAVVVEEAAAQADAFSRVHWVQYDVVKHGEKIMEGWYDHGSYRQEDGVETVVRLNKRFRRLAWGEAFVTESDGSERPSLKDLDGFSASQLVRPTLDPHNFDYSTGRTWKENGHNFTEIVATLKGGLFSRSVMVIDTDRDVLLRSTRQRRVGEKWEDSITTRYDFGGQMPASTFQPKAFEGKKVVQFASLHDDWERAMQKDVATVRLQDREVRIHDVWRNREGWIFVLYTSRGSGDWNPLVWLQDDRGVAYVRGIFEPSWSWNGEWQPAPLMVGGEKMQGLWMIPTAKTNARKLSLSFDENAGGQRRRLATVDLVAPPISQALTPPYSPVLSLYPFDANMARQMEAYAMSQWWHQRWIDADGQPTPGLDDGDRVRVWSAFAKNEPAITSAKLDPRRLEEELRWTYRLIDAQTQSEESRNNRYNNGDVWFRAYKLAERLGRKEEANEDLRRAQERNPEENYSPSTQAYP